MQKEKLVSVIVPVYRVEQYIDECIHSIISQTYKNLEIILVDDGSPDNCSNICDTYAAKYENIRVIHQKNGGLSKARLAGFEIAAGEYILFVDSDDYIHNEMVEKLVYALESKNAQMSLCAYFTVMGEQTTSFLLPYRNDLLAGKDAIERKYILPLLGNSNSEVNIPGFLCIRLLKRNLINTNFFVSERQFFLEDHIFDLLYADNIERIAIVNVPLYYYRVNRTSLSNCYRKQKWKMYCNLIQFYKEYVRTRKIKEYELRLTEFINSAIFNSIDNAVLAGTYHNFLKELKLISASGYYITKNYKKTISREIIKILYNTHQYKILYFFRKVRIKKLYG